MTVMVASLYDALIDAGAKDNVARKAAEEAASYENQFQKIESRINVVEAKITMIQWMIGINMAMTAGVLFKIVG